MYFLHVGTFCVKTEYIKSCLSEHTLKTKLTYFKYNKIKVIAAVYWKTVKLMIFSTEWV